MFRPLVLLTLTLAAAVAFAGCTLGGDTTTTTSTPATTTQMVTTTQPATTTSVTSTPPVTTTSPPPVTNATYTVDTSNVPALIGVGQSAVVSVSVAGASSVSSDHVGAHYGANASAEPSTTVYDKTCAHVAGTLPGLFNVNCTFPQEGTWHLRGHARYTTANATFNYWGPETVVKVVFYNVSIDNPPTAPVVANQSRTFTVNVTGNQTMGANPINVVWSWNSTAGAGSLAKYEHACQPTVGNVPGKFSVLCTFPGGGLPTATLYVRAHARAIDGAASADFLSREYAIVVGGLG